MTERAGAGQLSRKPVGLALGSGAARGLGHIGVIDALEDHGIAIDLVAGTSIGALIGALYASGVPVRQMEDVASNLNWRSLAGLLDPTIPTSGLIDGRKVGQFIAELLPARTFDELKIPLAVTTTDIGTGELIVIHEGDLLPAIQAAIAFPGLFAPVPFGERFLVDGGLCAPTPTDIVRDMGAATVIGVCAIPEVEKQATEISLTDSGPARQASSWLDRFNTEWIEKKFREVWTSSTRNSNNGEASGPRKPPGIFRVFSQSIAILENQVNTLRLQQESIDLLIRPDYTDITLLEFHRAGEAIAAGRTAAKKALSDIGNG